MDNGQVVHLERDVPGIGLIEFNQTRTRRAYYLTPPEAKRRRQLPSVTTVLSDTWPKPFLNRWYAKHGADAEVQLAAAAARGTAVHTFIERYLTTGELVIPEDPALAGYVQGAARFLSDYRPEPEAIELLVAHPRLGYAGRLDLRAMIGGHRTIVDFKTSPEGAIYAEAHVQTLAYAMADVECGAEPATRLMVVAIADGGRYRVQESCASMQLWEALLGVRPMIAELQKRVAGLAGAE